MIRLPIRRSPRLAVALFCGSSLISLCVFHERIWREYTTRPQSRPEEVLVRYEPLREWLPRDEATGFWIDLEQVNDDAMDQSGRFFVAQYAVSPCRLDFRAAPRWVVVDSDRPHVIPAVAANGGWTMVHDFGNGLRIFKNNGRK
jgi:hypothetical protein